MITARHLLAEPWVYHVGWVLLQFLWQGTLIALCLIVARAFLNEYRDASARYRTACAALGLMICSPIATFVVTQNAAISTNTRRLSSWNAWDGILPILVCIWVLGVTAFSARLVCGWNGARRLRSRRNWPAPDYFQTELQALTQLIGVSRPVHLLVSALVDVPTVVGWLRPAILIPVGALNGLLPIHVKALLAHELAHIRRADYLINIAQRVAEAVLFYHPAVWWVSAQIRMDRELCCDDVAACAMGDRLMYAQALAELETYRDRRSSSRLALVANGGLLLQRIRRLLPTAEPSHQPLPGASVSAAMLICLVTVGTFVATPQQTASQSHSNLTVEAKPATLSALLLPVGAAAKPQVASNTQKKTLRIAGTVIATDNVGIAGATMRLRGPGGNFMQTSDDAGRFFFDDVPPGPYMLTGQKAEFLTQRYGARVGDETGTVLNVHPDSDLTKIRLKMTRQGVLSGTVTSPEGSRLSGIEVQLMRYAYTSGGRRLRDAGSMNTDDGGNYRFENLQPGRYFVAARDSRAPARMGDPGIGVAAVENFVGTFYPDSLDPSGAAPVSVLAGSETGRIDIRIRRERVYTVSGHIVTATGQLAGDGNLTLAPKDSDEISRSTSANIGNVTARADGTFEFRNVPSGAYVLTGFHQGFSVQADVTVRSSNVDGLTIPQRPIGAIRGKVSLDSGSLQALLQPDASKPPALYPSIVLTPLSDIPVHGIAVVQPDGTFRLPLIGAVKYRWDISGLPEGVFVKSVLFENQDVTHVPLDNTLGNGGTLQILLSSKSARLRGAIVTDKNGDATGGLVTVWPKTADTGHTRGNVRTSYADQRGEFTFNGLGPGEYYIAAWEDLEVGLAQSAEFLAHFNASASSVTLTENGDFVANPRWISEVRTAAEIAKLP